MKSIINFFRVDIWRKLLALALTCLLYWNLSDRQTVSKELTVPVDVEVESGLFLPKESKYEAVIVVNGTERSLKAAKIHGRVKVTLKDRRKDGTFRIKLDESHFERRRDIAVTSIKTAFIEPAIQRYTGRSVKIVLKTKNNMSAEFRIAKLQCDPERIMIRGPENEVNSVREIETEELDLNCDRSFSQKLKLVKPIHMVNSRLTTSEVQVYAEVERVSFESKKFTKVPIRYLYPVLPGEKGRALQKWNVHSSITEVTVEVEAPRAVIDGINPEKLFVMADLPADAFTRKAKISVKLYCQIIGNDGKVRKINIYPESVDVTLEPDAVGNEVK